MADENEMNENEAGAEPTAATPEDAPATVEEVEAAAGATVAESEPAAEAVDAAAEAVDAAAEAGSPAPGAKRSKSRKHVPRAERRQRPRPKPAAAKTRKPLVRPEKPEGERGRRQQRRGVVVSAAMEKTIVVRVDAVKVHPRYKKVIRRSSKLHAHDEQGQAKVGDVVRLVETRPLSKTKRWRLAEIIEAAK